MKISIDLGAYRRNILKLREHLSPSSLMAVVKDDAYGHGIDRIVPEALSAGVERFAVLDIETGLRVREIVPRDVQLFAWLFGPTDRFREAIDAGIDLGVSNVDVLNAIASQALNEVARVHLKIDSGLHRNGSSVEQWDALIGRALHWQAQSRIRVVGIWTHIGEASDDEDEKSQRIFDAAVVRAEQAGLVIEQRHLAASAASFARADFRYDFCRVGGFTYGIAPGDGIGPEQIGLEAVMSATASVIDDSGVDGPGTVRVDAGYLDGIPDWNVASGHPAGLPARGVDVSFQHSRFAILEVHASYCVIDAGSAPVLRSGSEVTLFGTHLRGEPVLQEWADALGTVGEEIVVRVGPRGHRTYA